MTRRPRPQPRRAAPLAEGPPINIVDLAHGLLPRMVGGDLASWGPWIAALKALFALPLDETELALYRQHTGRATPPAAPAWEGWWIVGRRGGKSLIAALVAVYLAACRTYRLAAGERGTLMVIAADRRQARVVFRYIVGLLDAVPALAALVERRTRESVYLTNGVVIEVHTASFKAVRGYTIIGVVADEIAYWPAEDAAHPDTRDPERGPSGHGHGARRLVALHLLALRPPRGPVGSLSAPLRARRRRARVAGRDARHEPDGG